MSCKHPTTYPLGTREHIGPRCPVTSVPAGRYLVKQCRACRERVDVSTSTGAEYWYSPEVLRPYDNPGYRPGRFGAPNPRELYRPQYDGIAAANDRRKPWASDFVAVWS